MYLWPIRSENGALYPKRQGQANSPCCSSTCVAWSVATSFEVQSLFLETYRKNQGLKKPTSILRLRIAVAHRFRPGGLKSYPSLACSLPYLWLLLRRRSCLLRLNLLGGLLLQAESKAGHCENSTSKLFLIPLVRTNIR